MTIRIAWRWSILVQPKNMQNLQLSISIAADDFPIRLFLLLNLKIILWLYRNAHMCKPNYCIILQFCRFSMHVWTDPLDEIYHLLLLLYKVSYHTFTSKLNLCVHHLPCQQPLCCATSSQISKKVKLMEQISWGIQYRRLIINSAIYILQLLV